MPFRIFAKDDFDEHIGGVKSGIERLGCTTDYHL